MTKQLKTCPCDSALDYAICCGRYHQGKLHAPTAEALMRSRYSAYVLGEYQYLFRTWHEKTRPTLQSLRDSEPQRLVALSVISTQAGTENDEKGMVEFIASFEKDIINEGDEPIGQHKEKSLFVKTKGKWLYIDAI